MGFRSGPRFCGGVGGVLLCGALGQKWGWFQGGFCQVRRLRKWVFALRSVRIPVVTAPLVHAGAFRRTYPDLAPIPDVVCVVLIRSSMRRLLSVGPCLRFMAGSAISQVARQHTLHFSTGFSRFLAINYRHLLEDALHASIDRTSRSARLIRNCALARAIRPIYPTSHSRAQLRG